MARLRRRRPEGLIGHVELVQQGPSPLVSSISTSGHPAQAQGPAQQTEQQGRLVLALELEVGRLIAQPTQGGLPQQGGQRTGRPAPDPLVQRVRVLGELGGGDVHIPGRLAYTAKGSWRTSPATFTLLVWGVVMPPTAPCREVEQCAETP